MSTVRKIKKHVYLSAIILTKFKNRILQHKKKKTEKKQNKPACGINIFIYVCFLKTQNFIGA